MSYLHELKAALVPNAGQLYPANAGMMQTFPLTFPGWPDRGGNAPLSDEQKARLALLSGWVYSDIQAIAREGSVADIDVVELQQGQEPLEVDNHTLEMVWRHPNNFMGRSLFMQYWFWNLLLFGRSYIFLAPDTAPGLPRDQVIAEAWPIPAFMMENISDPKNFIGGYKFTPGWGKDPIVIPAQHIIYSRLPNPFDPRGGLSPMMAGLLPVQTDLAEANWNQAFFSKRNAVPSALVTLPAHTGQTDFNRIVNEIHDFYGGGQRTVAITRSGELDFKLMGYSPEQMQFVLSRDFNRKEIDRIFGFPGGYWSESATRANSEGAKATLIDQVVWPLLCQLSEDVNTQWTHRWYGKQYTASFEDIRIANTELELKELESYGKFETVNELRVRVGDKELPKGDPRGNMFVAEIGQSSSATFNFSNPTQTPTPEQRGEPTETGMVQEESGDEAEELKRWERKALRALKSGKPASVKFSTVTLDTDTLVRVRAMLLACSTSAQVKSGFADELVRVHTTDTDIVSELRANRRAIEMATKALNE